MLINLILIGVLIICVITDLRHRKIYNKVLYPGLFIAFLYHFFVSGFAGLWSSIAGMLTGLGLLIIPYLLGGMGAGDVKLLAVIGAYKGTMFVLLSSIYMALIGGAIALFILLRKEPLLKSVLYKLLGLRYGLNIPLFIQKDSMKTTYPYGVSIAGGVVMTFLARGWGLL